MPSSELEHRFAGGLLVELLICELGIVELPAIAELPVDIDAVLALETPLDVAEVLRWVGRIAGDTDRRYERIVAVLTNR